MVAANAGGSGQSPRSVQEHDRRRTRRAPIQRQYMHIKHIDSMGCPTSFHKCSLNEKIPTLALKFYAIAHNYFARFA